MDDEALKTLIDDHCAIMKAGYDAVMSGKIKRPPLRGLRIVSYFQPSILSHYDWLIDGSSLQQEFDGLGIA